MTPALKAKELIECFAEAIPPIELGRDNNTIMVGRDWSAAKQFAIIAVDEILHILDSIDDLEKVGFLLKDTITIPESEYPNYYQGYEVKEYFESVKEEIINL